MARVSEKLAQALFQKEFNRIWRILLMEWRNEIRCSVVMANVPGDLLKIAPFSICGKRSLNLGS